MKQAIIKIEVDDNFKSGECPDCPIYLYSSDEDKKMICEYSLYSGWTQDKCPLGMEVSNE